MSRTERRRWEWDSEEGMVWSDSARDKSCNNPICCGSEVSRRDRKRLRLQLKKMLRKDPDHMPTHLSTSAGDVYY